jgi:trigger factor
MNMQVSLTATGGLERRLEVAVPAERVASEVEQRLKRISRTARLKGFRPGKAPFTVIRRQFGEQVHAEVVNDLMRSSYADALSQEKLTPAAGPRIEPIAMGPGSDLKYAAVFEVLPEVRVKPTDNMSIERPVAAVTEADIDAMIESMRRQRPIFTAVERAVRDSDRVTVDYQGSMGGELLKSVQGTDVAFIVGARRVMTELEEAVKGALPGESRTVTVHFPPEHTDARVAGQAVEVRLAVKKIEESSLPAVDEEFMHHFGVTEGGIDALRAEVRLSMEREMAQAVRQRLRAAVIDGLVRDNVIEVPRALVEEQVHELQHEAARRMGIKDPSKAHAPHAPFEEPARRRVALGLIVGEIIRSANLKADRQRVQARVEEIASSYPNSDEVRRTYLQNAEAMRQIEATVLEDQVIDWVLERASVVERASSFSELTGFVHTSEAPT